ncbi:MAG: hypothetical protein HYY06_19005 [Deltaproteobacteria bacterium]|nr:hypothetical protein [Deltaproteobacteria bacterium]
MSEATALLGLLAVSGIANADEERWDPRCAAVPWTGAPAYVERRTAGGALAAFGGHFGVKAILDPDDEVGEEAAAAVALLDGRSDGRGRLAAIWTEPAQGERSVRFAPWGWEDGPLRVFWIERDALVIAIRDAGSALVLGAGGAREDSGGAAVDLDGARTSIWIGDAGGAPAITTTDRRSELRGPTGAFVIGAGDDATAAAEAGLRGLDALDTLGGAEAAWDRRAADFGARVAAASCSDVPGEEARRILEMAVAALSASAYAPRGDLERAMLSAARSLDNGFYGSDVPRQAMAVASFDPALARDALLGQLGAIADDSHVPFRFDDALARDPLPNGSLPPLQAQAFRAAIGMGVALSEDELDDTVRVLQSVAAWWRTNRDFRREGLLVHGSHAESGFVDSPRWPFVAGEGDELESEAQFFEAPDLNSDFLEYLEALADLETASGEDSGRTRERADELREDIDEELWDEEQGIWADLDTRTVLPTTTVGPHVVWPLAAGVTRDEERARRVVRDVLLADDRLWGDDDGPRPPLPSVAYDSPAYDPLAAAVRPESLLQALRALSRYGFEDEADRLRGRVLALVASRPEGLYDRYFVDGARDDDDPPVFQPGRTAAIVLGILHSDHERERFVMSEDTAIAGRIARARFIDDGARLYEADPEGNRLPRVVLESIDGVPLVERPAVRVTLQASCDVPDGTMWEIELPALSPLRWSEESGDRSGRTGDTFVVRVGSPVVVHPLVIQGGGCACATGAGPGEGKWSFVAIAALLVAAISRRMNQVARVRRRSAAR